MSKSLKNFVTIRQALTEHTPRQQLVDNTELNEKLANVATGPMKFFTIDTKSTEVPGVTSELDGYAIPAPPPARAPEGDRALAAAHGRRPRGAAAAAAAPR